MKLGAFPPQLFDPASIAHTHLAGDAGTPYAVLIDAIDQQIDRDLAGWRRSLKVTLSDSETPNGGARARGNRMRASHAAPSQAPLFEVG